MCLRPRYPNGGKAGARTSDAQHPGKTSAWGRHVCAGRRLRKRLTHAPPADAGARPPPRRDFLAPPQLLPGILMAWDFCSTYRCAAPGLGFASMVLLLETTIHQATLV